MAIEAWESWDAYAGLSTAPSADLAWEFLRRDPTYRRAYEAATSNLLPQPEADTVSDEVGKHWGLRWPGRPRSARR